MPSLRVLLYKPHEIHVILLWFLCAIHFDIRTICSLVDLIKPVVLLWVCPATHSGHSVEETLL
jgi:hypothetical protein